MRRMMVFAWLGLTALGAGLVCLALLLDHPYWPAARCRAEWADSKLATWSYGGSECLVYVNGEWLSGADVKMRTSWPNRESREEAGN